MDNRTGVGRVLISFACCYLVGCAAKDCVPVGWEASARAPRVKNADLVVALPHPEKRAVIALGGRFCEFYQPDVEEALYKVQGVRSLDFGTMKGNVIVSYEAGSVNPLALLAAVNSVKGDGYYCKGKVIP